MVLPYFEYTPEELFAKGAQGELSLEDIISILEERKKYYLWVIGGEAPSWNYPLTQEEACDQIGVVKDALEKIDSYLHPQETPLNLDITNTRDKLDASSVCVGNF